MARFTVGSEQWGHCVYTDSINELTKERLFIDIGRCNGRSGN